MLIKNQKVAVRWSSNNKKHFQSLGYVFTKIKDEVIVDLNDLTHGSHTLVDVECDFCKTIFKKKYSSLKSVKNHFCGKPCQNNFLKGKPSWNSRKFKTNCDHCNKEIIRSEFEKEKNKNFFCSKECSNEYKKGKSINEKPKISVNCGNCGVEIKRTENRLSMSKNHFCSSECSNVFSRGRDNLKNRKGKNVNCKFCDREFHLAQYRIDSQEMYFCNNDCRINFMKTDEYSEKYSRKEDMDTYITKNCYICNDEVTRKWWDFKSDICICSKPECKSRHSEIRNGNPAKEKIKTKCEQCNVEFEIKESSRKNNKWTFCSRECYHNFRSDNIKGDMIHNYQGLTKECDNCGCETKVTQYKLENSYNIFCSQACYYEFRSKYYIGEKHPQYGTTKTPEQKENMRIITANRIANGGFPQTNTSIQIKINEIVNELGYDFLEEIPFKYYVLDFYSPSKNLAIEVMGDYWHSNPTKYLDYTSLHDIQKKGIKRDKSKKTYLKKYYDINILYLWEKDINHNPELCKELIRLYYNSKYVLDDYNSFNYNLVQNELVINNSIIKPFFLKANTVYQTS